MKLLANENIPYESIHYLKAKGYDILSIGMDNPSITDEAIMNIAIKDERTIITFDRDYGELIFNHNYKPAKGVILLRLIYFKPDEPGFIIEEIINNKDLDLTQALTVVDKNGIRQRKY